MTKYAQYDSTITTIQPVLGWYDTGFAEYPNLPALTNLLELTDAEWDTRLSTPFVDGGMLVPKPTKSNAELLLEAQLAKITVLENAYNSAIQAPVSYIGATFQADNDSQNTLTKCLVAGSVPAGFFWLDASNVQVPMTYTELQGLAGAMLAQGQAAFVILQTRKAAVRAATTIADVQSVTW